MTTNLKPPKPCRHVWLIKSPNGPTSEGRCRKCKETGTFHNSHEPQTWQKAGRDRQTGPGKQGTRRQIHLAGSRPPQ